MQSPPGQLRNINVVHIHGRAGMPCMRSPCQGLALFAALFTLGNPTDRFAQQTFLQLSKVWAIDFIPAL